MTTTALGTATTVRRCHQLSAFGRSVVFCVAAILLASANAAAQQVSLAWDASADPTVTGYAVSYGTTSGTYTASLDVGNETTAVVNGLTAGHTYFFAVRSYNEARVYSAPSNEVSATIASTAPTISALSTASGAAGTPVTITGTNFGGTQDASTVRFNGTTASVTSWSATAIVATVPAGATSGNVVVTVNGVASNGATFTVTASPSIAALSPSSGLAGTAVTITGANFGAVQGASMVRFNGATASVSSWSATAIVATVPAGATSGNVVVTVNGVGSNGAGFTVGASPSIAALAPLSGLPGTAVTITGANFGAAQGSSTVRFNGTTASVVSWSPTTIVTIVPPAATSGNVVVTVNGEASDGTSFTVNDPPSIAGLAPSSGSPGDTVTITGANFSATQGANRVTFNGVLASVTSWSPTTIVATVPAGAASGNVSVRMGAIVSNGVNFTVTTTPSITGLSAVSGAAGSAVTITGTGFGAIQGSSVVTFSHSPAAIVSWSQTAIVATVPLGAASGDVLVTVNGVPSNAIRFVVSFTDPVLTNWMIRAVHISELRVRINARRAASGLAAVAWTDPDLVTQPTVMKAVHLSELRDALDAVYVAVGLTRPAFADAPLVPGATIIKAAHILDLREAVVALE